jgi:DNA modification methylase
MFINSIINKKLLVRLYLVQQKYTPSQEEYILLYGFNPIHNKLWENNYRYKFKDDKGKYRIISGGWSKPDEYLINLYGDRCIVDDGRVKGIKQYQYDDKGMRFGNMWDLQYGAGDYPTQKPYKLLERVISLSTV